MIAWSHQDFLQCYIRFNADVTLREKGFHLHREEVAGAAYAVATTGDPSLPPYYSDAEKHKAVVPAEVRDLSKQYMAVKRVKIPLQLDAQKVPVLADRP